MTGCARLPQRASGPATGRAAGLSCVPLSVLDDAPEVPAPGLLGPPGHRSPAQPPAPLCPALLVSRVGQQTAVSAR